MEGSFLAGQVRRCNRNVLILNLLLLGIVLGAAFYARVYLINFCFGPVVVEKDELRWNLKVEGLLFNYVTVEADRSLATGLEETQQWLDSDHGRKLAESTTAYYALLRVNDRFLLVKSPEPNAGTRVSGILAPVPSDIHQKFIAPTEQEHPDIRGQFLPYMLDATGFRGPGWLGLALGLPLLGLSLWNLRKVFLRATDAEQHPMAQRLAAHGPIADVDAAITAEIAALATVSRTATFLLTRSWLIVYSWFGVRVIPTKDLTWVFPKPLPETPQLLPSSGNFAAVVYHQHGIEEVCGEEEPIRQLIKDLSERAPWIQVGFSHEQMADWQRNATAFNQAAADRRDQIVAEGCVTRPELPPTVKP